MPRDPAHPDIDCGEFKSINPKIGSMSYRFNLLQGTRYALSGQQWAALLEEWEDAALDDLEVSDGPA